VIDLVEAADSMNIQSTLGTDVLITERGAAEFSVYLQERTLLDQTKTNSVPSGYSADSTHSLKKLWKSTDLSSHEFANEVAAFFDLRKLTLLELTEMRSLAHRFAPRFLREASIFPFETNDGRFALAAGDPSDAETLRAAEIVFAAPFELVTAAFEDIATVLCDKIDSDDAISPAAREAGVADENVDNLRDLASGAPVVRAVNDLIEKAVELRASDIHIEPFRHGLSVRMRVDGLLRAITAPAHVLPQALVSRIKILAGLNIAERRLPQDGAARLHAARTDIDIRVATMPTQHGEAAVIRLLPRDRGLLDIPKLGLAPSDEGKLRRLLDLPHGMIAVTGPTGSGKTTTLATMLSALNSPSRKIVTIEDPVEYEIAGINQSQVKPAIGLTFAAAMRAFVRQDPDVIMVGEVRDAETAKIAVHAALTGHLVLTTLHTETSTAAVPRLIDLGVEAFLLKSTLRAVIAQRLVRLLCERCRTERSLTSADFDADPRLATLGFKLGETVFHPRGCERCGGVGYRGRSGVFEVLDVSDEVRDLIGPNAETGALDAAAIKAGMTTMIDDAVAKCRNGATSVAEALRVTTVR
jgi:general secretion pathway protein E